jgi:Flp pilus assembly protein TadG
VSDPVTNGAGTRRRRVPAPGPGERGSVTAETAMVLPLLVGTTLGLVWLLSVAVTQVRVTDAAREVARALAREEPTGSALALGRRVAPAGAGFSVRQRAGEVVVTVTGQVDGPGGLFRFLPALEVESEAVAATETP